MQSSCKLSRQYNAALSAPDPVHGEEDAELSKEKLKARRDTKWNINETEVVAKWSAPTEAVEKQSRYTTCNNGANICCRKVAFV